MTAIRVLSLADIVERFNLSSVLRAMSLISYINGLAEGEGLPEDQPISPDILDLSLAEAAASPNVPFRWAEVMGPFFEAVPVAPVMTLRTLLTWLDTAATSSTGFRVSMKQLSRVCRMLLHSRITRGELRRELSEVEQRFADESDSYAFLQLAPAQGVLYDAWSPFGEDVATRFPSAQRDVAEATKCLAFERATACVFHLMRALELVMGVLMADMNEPYDPHRDSDWSKILAKCNQHIGGAGAKQEHYRDAVTTLTTVKHSWRNPTMHPIQVYTPAEAQEVWDSVRVFMQHLSTWLSE